MRKKKEIEELKIEISYLEEQVSNLRLADMNKLEEIRNLRAMMRKAQEDSDKRYAELLEKHITMMERMVRLNEQREAD